ncbi:MAG: hypothetical protein IPN80_01215 [Flavobacterium sp.]|nr:hypothetical protein [Flavobacterium sp.]
MPELDLEEYGWNKEPFLDIYKADYNIDGTITNANTVSELNSNAITDHLQLVLMGPRFIFRAIVSKKHHLRKTRKTN